MGDHTTMAREILGLLEANQLMPSSALLAGRPSGRSVLVDLRNKGYIVAKRGRGYCLTVSGAHVLRSWTLQERISKLELSVSTLTETVRELLPMAADPTVSAAEIHAGMMDLDPVDRELYDRLRMARNNMAAALGISEYQLGQNRALRMLADMQSRAFPKLLDGARIVGIVPGMTEKTWGRIGQTYLAVMERWVGEQSRRRRGGMVLQEWEVPA